MATTLEQDQELLKKSAATLSPHLYYALKYRIELKVILRQQIHHAQLALVIVQRLQAGLPYEQASGLIPELETKDGTDIFDFTTP